MYEATFSSITHFPAVYNDGYSKDVEPDRKAETILALNIAGNGIVSFDVNEDIKKACGHARFTKKYLHSLSEALEGMTFYLHNDMTLDMERFRKVMDEAMACVSYKTYNK